MSLYFLPVLAPLAFLISAAIGFITPGRRPRWVVQFSELWSLMAVVVSLASLALLLVQGPGTSPLVGVYGVGLSICVDAVSIPMLLLVSFIGWVVVRYAVTYLDGEARQGAFMGWLSLTLASVFLLVLAGNVFQLVVTWIAISIFLKHLLLFYPHRVAAQRAAKKKFLTARVGDIVLSGAAVMLILRYGTTDIGTILQAARGDTSDFYLFAMAGLIAIPAMLRSAQFPTHGWLTEVMEAPTPVSALLHAGVINAGGFLLIRFADVLLLAPDILDLLILVGSMTAVFGSLVMLTQPAVKTSLAWSTIAQMGFMILECGLGLFPLALLHIVAHSLYKAYSFLASGGAVNAVAAIPRPGPVAIPNAQAVGRAFLLALSIYAFIGFGFGFEFGFEHKSPQAVALGAILIFGVAYLLAQGLADTAPKALTRRTALYSVAASISYFALQEFAVWATAGTLPPAPTPGPLGWALIIITVVIFGLEALVQAMFPLWAYHPAAAGFRVHLSNGFYANALFDRLLGGWNLTREAGQENLQGKKI
jgi:NAD(P)H-quinone oxidoreductase subunit 5